ncbi:MAG: nucleotidyltransferase [Tissierellia bacterium]|nr:nucleotidyltransferase [Tissierellia bacterium]
MTVIGFITEYNPFHFGHKYHLDQSKKITGANFSIAIMSGSFVQRGEPSFVDKWTKAKMAIDNGVDLLIELPFIYATQSAELFAYGGIKLMDSLNIVDYISFGSELGEIEPLQDIADILIKEPLFFRNRLKYHLSVGTSFAVARSNALEEYISKYSPNVQYNIKAILNNSNNILGIEYLKALKKIGSKIKPITIKRAGSNYNDENIGQGFASATAIRHSIKNKSLSSVKDFLPKESYYHLKDFFDQHYNYNYIENYNQIFLYLLRTINKEKFKKYMDIEQGLENRLIDFSNKYNDIKIIVEKAVSKRYPRTRIQRILIQLLNQLDEETFRDLSGKYPSYIRVLGANKKGLILINRIKEKSPLPIITKFADYKYFKNKALEEILLYDKRATDLFYIGLNSSKSVSNMDYFTSPYISRAPLEI